MNITQEIERIQKAKADIKASIESKGVVVAEDATIDEYAALISSIELNSTEE